MSMPNPVASTPQSRCTTDTCEPATGQCVYEDTVVCDDGDRCTDDVCEPEIGCVYTDNGICEPSPVPPFNDGSPPTPVPTLSEWGLIVMGSLMALLGMIALRRRTLNIR